MTLCRSRPSAGGTVPTLFALLGTTGSAARGTTKALAAVSAASLALFGTSIAPVAAGPTGPSTTKVRVLSGRPDMVTGADVLIAAPDGTKFTVDGERVEATEVRPDQWLVDGLEPGRRVVAATSASGTTKLRIRVFPITGPVFSGPHLPLLACSTQSAGLGPPTDSDCSAPTTVTYQYWSSAGGFVPLPDGGAIPADAATTIVAGRTVPYVVRTETGVINRSVYWISILDPSPGADAFDVTGWNGRLVYRYGGGCGQSYGQGSPLAVSTVADGLLRAGYAVTTATFNTFQVQCNDVLSAETTMMVKEHFAETYGPPEFTIGDGGSGGAIQQLAIAQNYPGLLDAIAPTVPFPDAITIAPGVADCGLLANYFATGDGSRLTQDQRTAISGYQTWASCELWNASFLGGIRPSDGCDPAIPPDRIYDAKANPEGIRCDLADANANQLGIDPVTGFANRPLDNVGVQYGLAALSAGAITPEQFLDLNAAIGGYDVDGGFVAERTVASPKTVRRAYELGRVLQGDDALRALPIITTNFYTDSAGDIHTRVRLFTIRDRLADGGAVDRNHVIWTRPSTGSLVQTLTGAIGDSAALTGLLDQWVTTGERPSEAVDTCIAADGGTLAEGPDPHAVEQACNQTYPVFGDPRIAAGAPVGNDIVKCRRTEPGATDYAVQFTHTERARLSEVFPDGVCDWSSPGVGQVDKVGTWIDYTDPSAPIALGSTVILAIYSAVVTISCGALEVSRES